MHLFYANRDTRKQCSRGSNNDTLRSLLKVSTLQFISVTPTNPSMNTHNTTSRTNARTIQIYT